VLLLLRSELRKVSTVRGPWLLLGAGPLIVLAGIAGLVQSGENLQDQATQTRALGHVGLAAIFTLVFGILAIAGEYRHGTITDTYLTSPTRGKAVGAKLTVYGLIGAAAGLVCSATALAVTSAWWAAKGATFHLSASGDWRILAGGVAANIALAIIGVGLGGLVRNVVGAVALALAWVAVIEGIVGQLVGSGLARWLPFYASQALEKANITGTQLLSQWGGGLVLLAYAALFAGTAIVTTLRRDVT
jgi:ABC-2 type transport system permease protein